MNAPTLARTNSVSETIPRPTHRGRLRATLRQQWYRRASRRAATKSSTSWMAQSLPNHRTTRLWQNRPVLHAGKPGLTISRSPYTAFHLHDADLRYNTPTPSYGQSRNRQKQRLRATANLFAGARAGRRQPHPRPHLSEHAAGRRVTAHGTARQSVRSPAGRGAQSRTSASKSNASITKPSAAGCCESSPKGDLELLRKLLSRAEPKSATNRSRSWSTPPAPASCAADSMASLSISQLEGDLEALPDSGNNADTYPSIETNYIHQSIATRAENHLPGWQLCAMARPKANGSAALFCSGTKVTSAISPSIPVVNGSELHLAVADSDKTAGRHHGR